MQRSSVTVRLGGDLGNTVEKHDVSPAEIVVLREIHGGPDTVINIRPRMMDKVRHGEERERLNGIYGEPLIDKLFPGKFAPLPVHNSDIDVGEPEEEPEDDPEAEGQAAKEGSAPVPMQEDDLELVETIRAAKSKAELHALAKTNEVELEGVPDNMGAVRDHIIKSLFPYYTG